MRMWMIHPSHLCRQHLLGEHVELHMLVGAIRAGKSIEGYVRDGLVVPYQIRSRHEALVKELRLRGYKHKSTLPRFDYGGPPGYVKKARSYRDLALRCAHCADCWPYKTLRRYHPLENPQP